METISQREGENKSFSKPGISSRAAVKAGSWRERAHSHYQNILDLLLARGPQGVSSTELYSRHDLYGVSPRNRVSELRRDGFPIQTVHVNASTVRYVLLADRVEQPAPRDWHQEQTGKPRADEVPEKSTIEDLPLFAGVG
jgi:hypothetical protein